MSRTSEVSAELVAQLKENGEKYHRGDVDYAAFTARSRALWDEAQSLGIADAVAREVSRRQATNEKEDNR